MRVLVTGANGFVGTVVCRALAAAGIEVRAAVRNESRAAINPPIEQVAVGDLAAQPDWSQALAGTDAVVHLAGIAHVLEAASEEALALCQHANVDATLALAQAAAAGGVRRLVFMSSAKVHGEINRGRPWTESDTPDPQDPYSSSKWQAEQCLRNFETSSNLSVVVLRPPLVYGPGVKANFLRLLQAVDRGWPIPLGAIENRRSLVFVGNLADAVVKCLQQEAAAGRTYLVSDPEAVSTPELMRRVGAALQRPARLIAVPTRLLGTAARLLHRDADWKRLAGNVVVDTSAIRMELGWSAPYSMDRGLAETAAWFRSSP